MGPEILEREGNAALKSWFLRVINVLAIYPFSLYSPTYPTTPRPLPSLCRKPFDCMPQDSKYRTVGARLSRLRLVFSLYE